MKSSKPSRKGGLPPEVGEALAEVRAIYRELESRPVERQCTLKTECCRFRLTGKTPYLTIGEALVAARGLRSAGKKKLPESVAGACPLLHPQTGKCLVYADRPFGCRTHFCGEAGGPYPRSQVADLIHRLEKIDARLGGDGGRMLPKAVAEALEWLG